MTDKQRFKVQGWRKSTDGRTPMPEAIIEAVDGVRAAWEYASIWRISPTQWWNAGPKPEIVIRTEEIND